MPSSEPTTDPFSGIQLLSEDAFRSLGSMEAVEWVAPAEEKSRFREIAPGFALAAVLSVVAMGLQRWLPESVPLGAAALAMVLGIAFRNIANLPSRIATGCRWIVSSLIPVAIVLLGAGLDLAILITEGLQFLGFVMAAVLVASLSSLLLGKMLGVELRTSLLIGAGTGICGSSAILAVAPVIDADEEDILLSVGAINLIGLAAMFAAITIAALFDLPSTDVGILAGATIHAVPTVAAAAFDHSAEAGQIATLVKMGRVAMLVPFVLGVAVFWNRGKPSAGPTSKKKRQGLLHFVPWFVWGFVGTALLGSLGLIPDLHFHSVIIQPASEVIGDRQLDGKALLSAGGKLLLILAMAAIGLQVGVKSMLRTGGRAVLLATLSWAILLAIILTALLLR